MQSRARTRPPPPAAAEYEPRTAAIRPLLRPPSVQRKRGSGGSGGRGRRRAARRNGRRRRRGWCVCGECARRSLGAAACVHNAPKSRRRPHAQRSARSVYTPAGICVIPQVSVLFRRYLRYSAGICGIPQVSVSFRRYLRYSAGICDIPQVSALSRRYLCHCGGTCVIQPSCVARSVARRQRRTDDGKMWGRGQVCRCRKEMSLSSAAIAP
jgi:hypothetical protein